MYSISYVIKSYKTVFQYLQIFIFYEYNDVLYVSIIQNYDYIGNIWKFINPLKLAYWNYLSFIFLGSYKKEISVYFSITYWLCHFKFFIKKFRRVVHFYTIQLD